MRTKIKICCISSIEEARIAVQYGASALGLVSEMPSGPGVISEDLILEITKTIPPGISSFLLTCKQDAQSILAQQRATRVNTIQLCDSLPFNEYEKLKKELPGVTLVQVIHVTGEESIEEALEVAPFVNAVLLDSGNPSLSVKELGGTGRVHDWKISRKIRESLSIPLYLAGGLNSNNITEAVRAVRPFGVDLCNGVRTNGKLDIEKLSTFMEAIGSSET